MRILMLAQFYPPIIGGEERHVRNLSIELVARGHYVAVVTLSQENTLAFEEDQGVHIHRIRASVQRVARLFSEKGREHLPPFPDPEMLLALHRIIQLENPDIIHAHNWIVHSFIPLKAWCRAKLVVTLHDYSLVCPTKRLMYQSNVCDGPAFSKCLTCSVEHYGAVKGLPTMLASRLAEKVERRAVDMFLPVSQAVADGTQLAKYGVPYKVTPNFIPNNLAALCDLDHPLLAQLPQGDFLLFVGDLSRDKGVEVLLQAYGRIDYQISLVLIGRLVDDFSSSIPSNVHVLQNWPHVAVMAALKRSIIVITPSIWPDPCPTVAMEAMSMGKPVIASRIGGLLDIVRDGETGILVTPSNPTALQKALMGLLNDKNRIMQMGAMAKEKIVSFKAETVVSRIEQIYRDALVS